MWRFLIALSCVPACAAVAGTPEELAHDEPAPPPSQVLPQVLPQAPDVPPAEQRAQLPEWVEPRLNGAAVSLIGADAESIDILIGQFEHPQEAIVRFDRASGCAREVLGPWPTISTVVMGRAGFEGERVGAAELLATASDGALAKELASIVPIYAAHGNTGEDKLQFSRDGRHVIMQATDERLIASADGGASWRYLDGAFLEMPTMSPAGDVAVVRPCTQGSCGAPPKVASYRAGLVRFASLPKVEAIAGATLHDVVFDAAGSSVTLTRSDAFGKAKPTKICLESYALPGAETAKQLGCVRTTTAGYWHMMSVSPDRGTAVVASTDAKGAVTLEVRSLHDGSARASLDVPADWEHYQWSDMMVSDTGRVAYRVGAEPGAFGSSGKPGMIVLRDGGVAQREIADARPLGWLGARELVYLDRSKPLDEHGCGLVVVTDAG